MRLRRMTGGTPRANATWTAPSRSVRSTAPAPVEIRASSRGCGCRCRLRYPAWTIATAGDTAASSAFPAPWRPPCWGTTSTSARRAPAPAAPMAAASPDAGRSPAATTEPPGETIRSTQLPRLSRADCRVPAAARGWTAVTTRSAIRVRRPATQPITSTPASSSVVTGSSRGSNPTMSRRGRSVCSTAATPPTCSLSRWVSTNASIDVIPRDRR